MAELVVGPNSAELSDLLGSPERWTALQKATHELDRIVIHDILFGERLGGVREFGGYRFEGETIFENCVFHGKWRFHSCQFDVSVAFISVRFQDEIRFESCNCATTFGLSPAFSKKVAINGGGTYDRIEILRGAILGDLELGPITVPHGVGANDIVFPNPIRIVNFTGSVDMSRSTFKGDVRIDGGHLQNYCAFADSEFEKDLTLEGVNSFGEFDLARSRFREDVIITRSGIAKIECTDAVFHGNAKLGPGTSFKRANFSGSRFSGEADFGDVAFLGPTSFQRALFAKAPLFHGAALHQNSSFLDATFVDTESQWAEGSYRTLKQKSHDLHSYADELTFFSLELASRAHRAPDLERQLIHAYAAVSDYGRNVSRPLLIALGTFFVVLFANALVMGDITSCIVDGHCAFRSDRFESLLTLTKSQTLPFVPTAKEDYGRAVATLAGEGNATPFLSQLVGLAGFVVVAACLFLAGLGLRNTFRMKAA